MPNLVPYYYDRPVLSGSAGRRLQKDLGDLDARSRLKASSIEAAAELQGLRVEAIGWVAEKGVRVAVKLGKLEEFATTMAPLASGTVNYIVQTAALSIGDIVAHTERQVR